MGGLLRSVPLPTIWGSPEISFFAYYIRAPLRSVSSLTKLSPSDQLYRLLYAPPPRLVSVLTIWGPLRSVFVDTTNIWGPPQVSFFAYYRGPPQISFFAYYMGPPQVSFFAYYMGASLCQFLRLLCGTPQISFFAYYTGPPQISFLAYYPPPPPRSLSSLTIWGPPLRSVSLLTI